MKPDPTESWGPDTEPKAKDSPEWAAWRERTLNKARRCLELFRKEGRFVDRPIPPAPEVTPKAPDKSKRKYGETLYELTQRALEIERQGK